ncbi:MAG: trypsin-like peptidase domain-containing protein [Prolixibacteraceae bacterium]|nr:trypsin-like peptidase domain-containing protein [Prolixibacteraceae bacterium]
MNNLIKSVLVLGFIINHLFCFSQWLDPQTLQATVLLEKIEKNGFITHGTGTLLYNYDIPSEYIVVTCAHLVQGKKELSVRVRPDSSLIDIISNSKQKNAIIENAVIQNNTVRFIADLNGNNKYVDSKLDIAVFRLKIPPIFHITDTSRTQIKVSNLKSISRSYVGYKKELKLGDDTYFIGFPLGYGATDYVEPIVRSGSIAWLPVKEELFLLDAFSFGGNSGSPIFLKRTLENPGSLAWNDSKMIGMVTGHQSITLGNILSQPNPNELKFEKTNIDMNIGLARCVYMDQIMDCINKLMELNKN